MKALKTGGEVDSWCTKCRLVLNHRIIAMVGPQPVRVECSTCGSHHNYRPRAPGEKEANQGPRRAASSSEPRPARVSSMTKAAEAKAAREQSWEKAVMGRAVNEFRKYTIHETFKEGDLVRHTRFGDGIVTRIVDGSKVEILFKDEPRTLAQNLPRA